jgi:hypothetical protein
LNKTLEGRRGRSAIRDGSSHKKDTNTAVGDPNGSPQKVQNDDPKYKTFFLSKVSRKNKRMPDLTITGMPCPQNNLRGRSAGGNFRPR